MTNISFYKIKHGSECKRDPWIVTYRYIKLINMFSYPILKLNFKKLPLAMFWYNIKEEYTQLFEYVIKVLFSFQTRYLCEVEVFIYFNQSNVTKD